MHPSIIEFGSRWAWNSLKPAFKKAADIHGKPQDGSRWTKLSYPRWPQRPKMAPNMPQDGLHISLRKHNLCRLSSRCLQKPNLSSEWRAIGAHIRARMCTYRVYRSPFQAPTSLPDLRRIPRVYPMLFDFLPLPDFAGISRPGQLQPLAAHLGTTSPAGSRH